MTLTFLPMNEASAYLITGWHYDPPYHIYNISSSDPAFIKRAVSYFLDPVYQFQRILDEQGKLAAFCSFGVDAQVPGGDYTAEALDIGMGVRPDLTGQGLGATFSKAVIQFAYETYNPPMLRVTIASFNIRAQRVWQKYGFVQQQDFCAKKNQRPFKILIKAQNPSSEFHSALCF
ncbi:MAG: GNAT family N-acetyltransferase [Chloroflexi bacterium]|nr:GNAT family N-acetyltransferase [Chloroflexota bacterium]